MACAYSIDYVRRRYSRGDLASPHSLYAPLVLLHFFVPGVFYGTGIAPPLVNPAHEDFLLMAVIFSLAALIAVQVGSTYAIRGFGTYRSSATPLTHVQAEWKDSRIVWMAIGLLVLGWASRFYVIANDVYIQQARSGYQGIEGPFFTAIRMAELFPFYVLCLVSIRYWRPGLELSRLWRRALYASLIFEWLYWFPTGRKEPIILAVVLPLLIRYLRIGKLPSRRAIVAFLAFILLLFPLAFFYRYALEVGGGVGDAADMAAAAAEALANNKNYHLTPYEIVFGRLSLLEPVGACIRIWEYGIWEPMMGRSYVLALTGFIPRFIWPDKPELHYGNEFGFVTGYLSADNFTTSISVTFFGEAFLNFGLGGVIPLAAMGFLFGIVYRKIHTSNRQETWLLVYSVCLPTILYIGGTFALYFGGLIRLVPFFYLVGRLMDRYVPASPYSIRPS
jgi:hypothetical protein